MPKRMGNVSGQCASIVCVIALLGNLPCNRGDIVRILVNNWSSRRPTAGMIDQGGHNGATAMRRMNAPLFPIITVNAHHHVKETFVLSAAWWKTR